MINLEEAKVLAVDDSESNIDILVEALGDLYDLQVAMDGEAALEIIKEEHPDIILLDIMMPDMDGYQVIQNLQKDKRTKNIPVIFLSALTEIKSKSKGFDLGAVDYITKPFEIAEVQARVKTHLTLRKTQLSLKKEHARSESLLKNILPGPIAQRLKQNQGLIADRFESVSVMFADIVNFTPLASNLDPEVLVKLLNRFFSHFDDLADKYGVEKIKTIGDSYMAVCGLPLERDDHAVSLVNMGLEMLRYLEEHKSRQTTKLQLRIGIHSGDVVAGVIGKSKFIYDLWGDTVNIASRLESHGIPGTVHVSQSSYDLTMHEFNFESRGQIDLKGKGKMSTYLLHP